MGKKYRITYDRSACIGAMACAEILPKRWKMTQDKEKADLVKGKQIDIEDDVWELVIDEGDYSEDLLAAEACPVFAIKIEEITD
ncbi:ferredoxin [Candidatus Woesearchaeota archaeon]|nr:ferredoxin [Candidatus Woesearchaeota archaeon]|tara:strand:- start:216 stop:467 length:252 start_codon:yes stop_codon:yes gene_type:complete